MPITLDPISLGDADGYYVSRQKVIETAGQDNFDLGFNLDDTATTADEAVAQNVFDMADRFVDSRAFLAGLTADAGATSPHFIATTNVIFPFLSDWASRYARAQGYLLRGVTGSEDATKAEGQMQDMRDEAMAKIDELLRQYKLGNWTPDGIDVVRPRPICSPCGIEVF